jgi:hypothetical protein
LGDGIADLVGDFFLKVLAHGFLLTGPAPTRRAGKCSGPLVLGAV